MLDFTELSKDGDDFERLIRELLFARGYRVYWSGKGPDGGRDLLCYESHESLFEPETKLWLIQCKHHAHSGKSVGTDDLDDIVASCVQHGATGYIVVCSTHPSAPLVDRLEGITKNPKSGILATYWDSVQIERLLTTPRFWPIAQRFFPKSASASGWQIYATSEPNRWVTNYRGYYFHLTNRIGSKHAYHLDSIEKRIAEIEEISLPPKHYLRPRLIFYDDKNGGYTWHVDYMRPREENGKEVAELLVALGDGYSWNDGQVYSFEINEREYLPFSDHFDIDHYDYYRPYLDSFSLGSVRRFAHPSSIAGLNASDRFELVKLVKRHREDAFSALVAAIKKIPGLEIIRAINCMVEYLDDFRSGESWIGVASEFGFDVDRFFSAKIIVTLFDCDPFLEIARKFPIGAVKHYRLARVYWLEPDGGLEGAETRDFDFTISVNPVGVDNQFELRQQLNEYFTEITAVINKCVSQ